MQIRIPLPQCNSVNTYKELKGYLKQLELAIHHAQKAVVEFDGSRDDGYLPEIVKILVEVLEGKSDSI